MSTATLESNTPRTPAQKRNSMASASTEPHSARRVKTETTTTTEPKASKSSCTVSDSIYDAIVTVKVGESATIFQIHRGLLCCASRFCKEKLAHSETTEGGAIAQIITMKEENPETFRRFKNWLYSHKITSESETSKNLPWSSIIAVYTFPERCGIPLLQNTCIDTVVLKRKAGGLFPAKTNINTLWKAPGQVFRLRRLVLDMFARECNLSHAIANNGSYHPKFLQGMVQTLYEMNAKETVYDKMDWWRERQRYYVEDAANPLVLD